MKLKQQQEGRKQDKALQYAKEKQQSIGREKRKTNGSPLWGEGKKEAPSGGKNNKQDESLNK